MEESEAERERGRLNMASRLDPTMREAGAEQRDSGREREMRAERESATKYIQTSSVIRRIGEGGDLEGVLGEGRR